MYRCVICGGSAIKFVCKNCAPAQEEKEMVCIDCGAVECSDVPICDECNEARRKRCDRTADLRELHRAAALAALCGCATYDTCVEKMVASSIRYADEFIRQYNPDAVIAEVVG